MSISENVTLKFQLNAVPPAGAVIVVNGGIVSRLMLYVPVAYTEVFHAQSVLYHTTVQLLLQFAPQYDAIFIVFVLLHVLAVHHDVTTVPLNILI